MREQRAFFAWSEHDYIVKEVIGHACLSPKNWWIPSLGYTGTIGSDIFESYKDAFLAAYNAKQTQILYLKKQLARLESI